MTIFQTIRVRALILSLLEKFQEEGTSVSCTICLYLCLASFIWPTYTACLTPDALKNEEHFLAMTLRLLSTPGAHFCSLCQI